MHASHSTDHSRPSRADHFIWLEKTRTFPFDNLFRSILIRKYEHDDEARHFRITNSGVQVIGRECYVLISFLPEETIFEGGKWYEYDTLILLDNAEQTVVGQEEIYFPTLDLGLDLNILESAVLRNNLENLLIIFRGIEITFRSDEMCILFIKNI